MSAFEVKGWCPGALRPMLSGDGLVVRVRPHAGRLTSEQAAGIAGIAARHGNGLIDLTSRANLQIRGVSDRGLEAVLRELSDLGLLDGSESAEGERNILVSPFEQVDDDARAIARDLEAGLAEAPLGLPGKFGFAIDCGRTRALADAPADIRIERGQGGALIVRADGVEKGRATAASESVTVAISLARWFVRSARETGIRRMAALVASGVRLPADLEGDEWPVEQAAPPEPGLYDCGALVGFVFGQLTSATLLELAAMRRGLRTTPWRMLMIEDLNHFPCGEDYITAADDPRLRVVACTGAPGCPQALAPTRKVALHLASLVPEDGLLHVSGCAKGCALRGPALFTLVATPAGFDLVRNGSPSDVPALRSLAADRLHAIIASLQRTS